MLALLPALVPILLVDVANPVLFAMLVFAAGSSRPVLNSASMLLGHTLAYFSAGIVLALALGRITARLQNPQSIDFAISGIIGIGLLWMVLKTKREGPPAASEPEWELTPLKCFVFGAVVNFVGIPFALPYFAAIDQLLKADLGTVESLTVLAAYNLAYAAPFLVVPIAVAIAGDSAKPMLGRINDVLTRFSEFLMPWMLGLLGAALVADSVTYFYRGTGLWEF